MASRIRHKVSKNSIVLDNSFSKTRRIVKNETKRKLKCFLDMDCYKLRVKWSNVFLHQFNVTPHGKKYKMAFYSCGWSVTLQMPVSCKNGSRVQLLIPFTCYGRLKISLVQKITNFLFLRF